jgi:tetratricopeptide (TPR) repeat protein
MRDSHWEPGDPGSFQRLHDAALGAFGERRWVDAERLSRSALEISPEDTGARNLLGQALLSLRRPDEAAVEFERAIAGEPTLPNLHFNLALARQAEGKLVEAIRAVSEAIRLDGSVPILHAKLGQLLVQAGRANDAVLVLRRALELDSRSLPVRLNLAQALTDLDQIEEAERLVRAALFLVPKDATANRLLGRIFQIQGKFDEAVVQFEMAIAQQPNQVAAHFALAYSKQFALTDRAQIDRMERLVGDSGLSESDRSLLHYAIGKAYDDLAEYESAIGHFDQANEAALRVSGRRFDPELENLKVDRLIEIFTPELLSRVATGARRRPIFIVGMIRSGTTLVEQILSRHSDVAAGGELPYWTENQPRFLFDLMASDDREAVVSGWTRDYDVVLDQVDSSAPFVTDKMPLNFWSLGLIRLAYPDAVIVHCRRQPRDTALSIYVTPFRRSPEFGHSRENILSAYRAYERLMDHWRSVIPWTHFLEVDYEALVKQPDSEIPNLVAKMGVNWDPSCLEESAGSQNVRTPSQWQVRQPVYRSSIDRWRNYERWGW